SRSTDSLVLSILCLAEFFLERSNQDLTGPLLLGEPAVPHGLARSCTLFASNSFPGRNLTPQPLECRRMLAAHLLHQRLRAVFDLRLFAGEFLRQSSCNAFGEFAFPCLHPRPYQLGLFVRDRLLTIRATLSHEMQMRPAARAELRRWK